MRDIRGRSTSFVFNCEAVNARFKPERVGKHPVRGFNEPIELFAYHG
jgi:hypothetical protein